MTLTEWIDDRLGEYSSRNAAHHAISEQLSEAGTPISWQTVASIDRGMRLANYARAKALSDLTKGAVSVAELCE